MPASGDAPSWRRGAARLIPEMTCSVCMTVPGQRPATVQVRARLYHEATRVVHAEYGSDLALDDLAHRLATSRRQLQRAYAEAGATSFRRQLTRVRMERAADRLQAGELTVRDVAREVGYRQPAQFAKAFRRHFGHAPSDHRLASPEQPRARSAAA